MRHWLDIADILFRYIGMLKEKGPQEWVFNEIRDIANIQYRRDVQHKLLTRSRYLVLQLKYIN